MTEPFKSLSELERDALAELSNIAMARAASSLRKMVDHEVALSVPSVEVLTQDGAIKLLDRGNNPKLVAVRQDFSGVLTGRALLIFPEARSLELVRVVVGKNLTLEDIVDLEDEALAETGNIILNSWVSTIANLLNQGLKMSLPTVLRGSHRHMFEVASSQPSYVLFLHINFEIRDVHIEGFVALLMDIPTLDEFRGLIAQYIARATSN
jgi:chemotaxis protein CheC